MPSAAKPVAAAHLAAWPTKRLLALRDRLLRCEANLEASDIQGPGDLAKLDPTLIHFKDDPRWKELYDAVRSVLSTRGHVPGGDERAEQRRVRASEARGRPRSTLTRR